MPEIPILGGPPKDKPDRPVFGKRRDMEPQEFAERVAKNDPRVALGIHRHRTTAGATYTHSHDEFTTPHLHERDDPRAEGMGT